MNSKTQSQSKKDNGFRNEIVSFTSQNQSKEENENKSDWVSFMRKFSYILEKLTESKNIFSR